MKLEADQRIDIRPFKERLGRKLPPDSAVLADLMREPDSMAVSTAEVLIPHYLRRLERELESRGRSPSLVMRA
jgi:hypothetical protein